MLNYVQYQLRRSKKFKTLHPGIKDRSLAETMAQALSNRENRKTRVISR